MSTEPERGAAAESRYEIEERIGAGAFGTVYRARDREEGQRVALKRLKRADGDSLYRFKREFRSLTGVRHTNLVALHELFKSPDGWAFTMDLIDGEPLTAHLEAWGPGMTRRAFRQLVAGLGALHDAGVIHRDLKPANVLVAEGGHVTILDFGFVADRARPDGGVNESLVGTPEYMSPEQAAGEPVGPATDLYGVGAMLFEVLTGRPPFVGEPLAVFYDKQEHDPPSARDLAPDADVSLARLADALVCRDPARRPSLAEVRLALGQEPSGKEVSVRPVFVGRVDELASLDGARVGESDACSVVFLEGPSGTGKSALLTHFSETATKDGAVVLAGRCFDQESVPYKALDGVVDALCAHLAHVAEPELSALLPDGAPTITMLFPVLGRVPALRPSADLTDAVLDRLRLREMAFGALIEVLRRLGRRRELVVIIDDLQWGDADSAAFMRELLLGADPPRMLLVGAFRTGERAQSALLSNLLPLELPAGTRVQTRELAVSTMLTHDAASLATRLLAEAGDDEVAARIAVESGGNPLFVGELVELVRHGGPARVADLDSALERRVASLPGADRGFLETIALAGRPLPPEVARSASAEAPRGGVIHRLCSSRLLRRRRASDGEPFIEPYHDRVREAVARAMAPADQARCHGRLGDALEAQGLADPETLARHFENAGRLGPAGRYFATAADRALAAVAWDHSAQLYRRAIDLEADPEAVRSMRVRLGHALAGAGRGAEAAASYRAGLEGADPDETIELWRLAADQLLRCGRTDEGYPALDRVLRAVGMRLTPSAGGALANAILNRYRIERRGLDLVERAPADRDPALLRRIDVAWSAAVSLTVMDSARGADYLSRSLLWALEAGEPFRYARSMAYAACYRANVGSSGVAPAMEMIERVRAVAKRHPHPYLEGLTPGATTIIHFSGGQWRRAVDDAIEAEEVFRAQPVATIKEVATVRFYRSVALALLGDYAALRRFVPTALLDAEERGDLYSRANFLSGFPNLLYLVHDDPRGASRAAQRALSGWQGSRFLVQHYFDLHARAQIMLYEGDAEGALALIEATWGGYRRSLLMRIMLLRVLGRDLRARASIAAAERVQGRRRERLLRNARKNAALFSKEGERWATPLAESLLGRAAILDGRGEAGEHFTRAIAAFEAVGMAAHGAAALRRRGQVRGDAQEIADADARLAASGVVSAARFCRVL